MSQHPTIPTSRRRVTLEEVAAAAGLGRTTVSDILNRKVAGKYSDETRSLVLKAVRELGYAPARAAQQLASGRSGQIGLMLTRDLSNPFFARVADVVEREVRQLGYRLLMGITDGDPDRELDWIRQMQGDAVEGLIVGPVYEQIDLEQHRSFFQGRLPIVLFGGSIGTEFDEISLDQQAGWRLSLDHLLARRHRRIAVLALPPSRLAPDRPNDAHGVVRLFRELGLYRPEWFVWQQDTGRFADFYAACARFVERWKAAPPHERPTAALCHNDQVAMTALAALSAAGVRVPADVSLVGYDNLPESAYLVPALTTVDNRSDEQMRMAVAQLRKRIEHPDDPKEDKVIAPVLVERASVATVATAGP